MNAEPCAREIAAECFNGREVRDANGDVIGRIADICVQGAPEGLLVKHYWVARTSAANRVAAVNVGWHLLRIFGIGPSDRGYLVRWDEMDLSDLDHLRTTCAKTKLERA